MSDVYPIFGCFLSLPSLNSLQVRFAALSVLKELFVRLSEEYVALLPETIPALAELLEGTSLQFGGLYCSNA